MDSCKHTQLKVVHESPAGIIGAGDLLVVRCASCDTAITVLLHPRVFRDMEDSLARIEAKVKNL